jgi:hypothetical protein
MISEECAQRFKVWLRDAYRDSYQSQYAALFGEFLNKLGRRNDQENELEWLNFIAAADAWAASIWPIVEPTIDDSRTHILLPVAEKRDPFSGLRHAHKARLVPINLAHEEDLRQVPGISARAAQKIIRMRTIRGPFLSLRDLVTTQVLDADSFRLAEPNLELSQESAAARAPFVSIEPSFISICRLSHALLPFAVSASQHAQDLADVAISKLTDVVRYASESSYWRPGPQSRDPMRILVQAGTNRFNDILANNNSPIEVSVLDSRSYLALLRRSVRKAKTRLWLQIPILNIAHVRSLSKILDDLGSAVKSGVDVRVLFDKDGTPDADGGDDIVYLKTLGVNCRFYPFLARMHSRVILIDDDQLILGSHSWSAYSMFRSEELGIYARSCDLASRQSKRFKALWDAAGTDGRLPLPVFFLWSAGIHEKLIEAGMTDTEQLLSSGRIHGISSTNLSVIRREVRLVIRYRLPIPVAHRLARANVDDLGSFGQRSAVEIDDWLASAAGISEPNDFTPIGNYIIDYLSSMGSQTSEENAE